MHKSWSGRLQRHLVFASAKQEIFHTKTYCKQTSLRKVGVNDLQCLNNAKSSEISLDKLPLMERERVRRLGTVAPIVINYTRQGCASHGT